MTTKRKPRQKKQPEASWKFPESFNLDMFLRDSYQEFKFKDMMGEETYKAFAEDVVRLFMRKFP